MTTTAQASGLQALLDRALLRTAEEKAKRRAPDAQERIARLVNAADARLTAADAMTDERSAAVALDLYRQAATWIARAMADDRGEPADDPWKPLDKELEGLTEHFASTDPLLFDAMPREEQIALRDKARAACARLRAEIEPRSAPELRAARRLRVVLALALAAIVLGYWLRTITHPTNYALGANVSMSSQFPGTPNPAALVNGEMERFGGHTAVQSDPWIQIDLGQERSIREIRLYNRGDDDAKDMPPLDLSVSSDGVSFQNVGRREVLFTQQEPWIQKTSATGRYVRVSKSGQGYIALSEIEVY